MSAATSIGKLRRVAGVTVHVPDYVRPVVSLLREDGMAWMGDATDARTLGWYLIEAADQADAMARAKREAQRAEEKALARLVVISRQIECRGCRELATRDGLCDLCIEARDRAQRIVGVAGEVTL